MTDDPAGDPMDAAVSDLCVGATARDVVGGDRVDGERLALATRLYVGARPADMPDRRAEVDRLHLDAKEIVPDDADSLVDLVAAEPVVAERGGEVLSGSETMAEALAAMDVDPDEPVDRAAAAATRRLAAVMDEVGPDSDGAETDRLHRAHQRYFTTMTLYDTWRRAAGDAPAAGRPANQTPEVRAVREARRESPVDLLMAADDLSVDDPPTVGEAIEDVLGDLARETPRVAAHDGGRGHETGR